MLSLYEMCRCAKTNQVYIHSSAIRRVPFINDDELQQFYEDANWSIVKVWGDRKIELHYIKDIDSVNRIPYNIIIVITSQLESVSEELLEIQTKYAKYISIWQITWYTDAPPKLERVGSNIFLKNGSLSDLEEDDSFSITKRIAKRA